MVQRIYAYENQPYPNSTLPVLYYKNALKDSLGESFTADDVLELFERNGYTNGWVNGIHSEHHFHPNTHEVLACVEAQGMVQIGGDRGEITQFRKGDILLVPAGVAHKKVDGDMKFQVVGAYPEELSPEMQYGNADDYESMRSRSEEVEVPKTDPLTGSPGAVDEYWK